MSTVSFVSGGVGVVFEYRGEDQIGVRVFPSSDSYDNSEWEGSMIGAIGDLLNIQIIKDVYGNPTVNYGTQLITIHTLPSGIEHYINRNTKTGKTLYYECPLQDIVEVMEYGTDELICTYTKGTLPSRDVGLRMQKFLGLDKEC